MARCGMGEALQGHLRWLKTRQQWARAQLHDAEVMVIGDILIANAREDLEHTTGLIALLTERHQTLPLFPPTQEG
jgi:hypothetical protein